MIIRVSHIAVLGVFLSVAVSASAFDDLTIFSDEFDDPGSLSHWSRIYETEGWGNDVLEVFDANITRPGHLVMTPYSSSWFEEWRGELTYKNVTGDFVITTFVEPRNRAGTGRPERDYSLAGIMVRVPRAMTNVNEWTAGGQNYVFLSMGSANRATAGYEYEVKTTSNSTSVLFIEGTDATRAAIQVARLGPHLIMMRRDEGEEWVVHRRYYRPDFPETLQAGLTVYTDWDTVFSVGVENNNQLILTNGVELIGGGTLSGAEPDLVAAFDYVRFARPLIPGGLEDADFSNPGAVTDEQLLLFLGDEPDVPGGAAQPPEIQSGAQVADDQFQFGVNVISQRSYRVQSAPLLDGNWSDTQYLVSTNTLIHIDYLIDPAETQRYFRLISP